MNYQRLYEYRFKNVDQAVRQAVWNVIADHIYREMGNPQRVLDPAAGRCEFINAVPAEERWVVDEVNYAEAFKAPAVRIVIADVLKADLPKGHFDGVFVSNFLEHLHSPEEIAIFLDRMIECLEPGGTIAVMGPNFKYCSSEYFDCADHNLPLTHIAVEEMLYQAGFELSKTIPRFLPFSFRGVLLPSPALTGLYLKLPFAWPLLGKQFILYARKPA